MALPAAALPQAAEALVGTADLAVTVVMGAAAVALPDTHNLTALAEPGGKVWLSYDETVLLQLY
jgi:hypothetical protein